MKNKKVISIIIAGLIAALSTTMLMTSISGAIQFSETHKDIEIVFEEFTGYRFNGPDAPAGVDTSKIAKVKFYIKCPDLESIEEASVQLVFNSGTTGWVESEHDLNDGLIIDVDVPGVVAGDFFDAALGTWNEEISGTFSVEVLDAQGEVIGEGVYTNNEPEVTETTTAATTETGPKDGTAETTTTAETTGTSSSVTTTEPEPKDGTTASGSGTATAASTTEPGPKDGTTTSVTATTSGMTTTVTHQSTEAKTAFTVAGAQETESTTTSVMTGVNAETATTEPTTSVTVGETTAITTPTAPTKNVPTGNMRIVTAMVMTAVSAMVIVSTKKKR